MIYNLFISHSWKYDDQYDRLEKMLNGSALYWKNYSVPIYDPFNTKTDKDLTLALERQISPCSRVLVIAGVYASYSKWIAKELQIAKALNKPIIAIEPRGVDHTSVMVKDAADIVVGWSTSSIISAIKELSK